MEDELEFECWACGQMVLESQIETHWCNLSRSEQRQRAYEEKVDSSGEY